MLTSKSPDKFDPLFDEVASLVVEKQEISESFILNHFFGIGYRRAFEIMNQLEDTGIIGGNFNYVLPRKIYVQDIAHLHSKLEQIHRGIYEPANEDEQREKYREIKLQREKQEIAAKIKEKYRRRELEKLVRQELIDSGELFGDQPKREPIPREIVSAIYQRDGGRCVYCGSTQNLQIDHIIPFSKGGATTLENLQLLCQKCNLEKSNKI